MQGYLANVCPPMWDANQDLNRLRVQLNIQAFPHAAQKHIVELSGWQNFQMSIRHRDCTIKSTITSNFRAVKVTSLLLHVCFQNY